MEKSSFLRCRINALFNVLLVLALLMIPCLSTAALTGPVDAPPGGAAVTITPNTDGDIGKAGGRTYTYSDIVRANEGGLVYWGITEDSVKLSLDFDTDYVGDEVMTFDPARSDLPNGIVVWVGSTSIYNAITRTTVTLTGTYFTLTVTDDLGAPLALTQPDTVGLPAGMGGVLEVTAGMEFNANMIFRIADGTPAYDYYNAYPTIGSVAYTSVDYGFYYNPVEISDIGDQLIQINSTSDPYTFTISNATGTPLLSGTSSDQSVVADAGITFSYVDPDWTVTIVPVADASGSTTITISVTDEDELTATETFVLTVNGPPTLTANQPIAVNRGGSVVLTTTQLSASDNESGPEELDFLVGPDGNGGPPRFGELLLDGTPLAAGESFTQQQLADGLVSYQHDDSCDQPADDFQFDVRDADGGSAVLAATAGQYQSYTFAGFLVQYPNRAPVAIDDAISIPMGVPYSGTLTSSDDDCVQQQMTYSIVTNGSRGTAVITDAATGAYTYTPAPGELGSDSFTFMVNDGTADAATPGTITIEIENQAPTANDLAASTTENDPVSGMLSGSDADLPAQTLTYGLNTDGTLGSVFISASSGMFTYTPLPGAFGEDTFTYYVRDGYVNSAPATVTVSIAPDLNNGDLLISGSVDTQVVEEPPGDVMAVMDAEIDNGCRVVLVDPVNGYEAVVASGGLIGEAREIRGIAVESCRTILLIDGTEGASRLLRVNLLTGEQSVVYSDLVFPIDVVVEASGNILISDGPVGIKRIDPSGGLIGVFSGSEVTFATGLTVATEGAIFASNAGVASGMPGAYSSVLKIDPVPTLITANENLFLPIGITLGTDENLYVAEALPIFTDGVGTSAIVRVLADGSQEMVAADGDLMGPTDVIEHTTGELLVTNMMGGDLVSVDPDTGNTFMFKITDLLDRAWALTVLPNDDSDGDGIPDECDICDGDDTVDSDGDGVPDACDICPLGDDAVDVDLDGVPDACDICFPGDATLDAD
ncbi:MAG: hypothetical protein C0622_07770 [Desulfuromonas sp.]|nr:MAG: hypothetical protein C0622_07770 [Desulfuromonas sp.]